MRHPPPYIRESGSGPGVVCIHSNASTSGQWRGLMEMLSPAYRVLAPDSWGSGKSPEWPSDRVITLADEVALIEPALAEAGAPWILVGHSYGAAVALKAALRNPSRVRALALYEPTLFSLIEADRSAPNDADGIRGAVTRAGTALDAGNRDAAAQAFIDYWMGEGSWAKTPEQRKPPIADSTANVRRWWHALSTEPTPLAEFRKLDMPVLYMVGKRSTASAHGVARLLVPTLPHAQLVEFDGLGHMGPITHADVVNREIERFLAAI